MRSRRSARRSRGRAGERSLLAASRRARAWCSSTSARHPRRYRAVAALSGGLIGAEGELTRPRGPRRHAAPDHDGRGRRLGPGRAHARERGDPRPPARGSTCASSGRARTRSARRRRTPSPRWCRGELRARPAGLPDRVRRRELRAPRRRARAAALADRPRRLAGGGRRAPGGATGRATTFGEVRRHVPAELAERARARFAELGADGLIADRRRVGDRARQGDRADRARADRRRADDVRRLGDDRRLRPHRRGPQAHRPRRGGSAAHRRLRPRPDPRAAARGRRAERDERAGALRRRAVGRRERRRSARCWPRAARGRCARASTPRTTSGCSTARRWPAGPSASSAAPCTTGSATCWAAPSTCRTPRRTRPCCRTSPRSTRRRAGGAARLAAALGADDLAGGVYDLARRVGSPTGLRELGLAGGAARRGRAGGGGRRQPRAARRASGTGAAEAGLGRRAALAACLARRRGLREPVDVRLRRAARGRRGDRGAARRAASSPEPA